MKKIILASLLCLVSISSYADRISKISIFQTHETAVNNDLPIGSKSIPIEVFHLDSLSRAEKEIDREVKARTPIVSHSGTTPLEKFQLAFSDLLNSPEWGPINETLEQGAKSVEYTARYQIKKLPAVVFNDSDIVYGVRSMSEAVRIYNRAGGL